MPDQPSANDIRRQIIGFAAGTPLLTPKGYKPIEDVKPGNFIQTGPDEEQPDDRRDNPDPPRWWERN